MMTVHGAAYWLTLLLMTAALVVSLVRIDDRSTILRIVTLGLVAQVAAAGARWWLTGHPPIFGTYENTIAASWALGVVLVRNLLRRDPPAHPLVVRALLAWMLAILAYGQAFDKTPYPLTISERSVIVDVHVIFAWTAFSVLIASAMHALARIVEQDATWHPSLDRAVLRGVGVGFATLTSMMVVGSLYSYALFTDWYRWEIVGASTFAAWLGYGLSLHAYLMFGWRGRRFAWCALALVPLVLMAFWSWSVISSTYHHFDIPVIKAW